MFFNNGIYCVKGYFIQPVKDGVMKKSEFEVVIRRSENDQLFIELPIIQELQ